MVSLILKPWWILRFKCNFRHFWPHFFCNSSACTSWLWIGIRYLSNWNKFKPLTWNIKFYKCSYSHSISTDYSIITGGVTMIFFSQESTKKQNLTYFPMDHQGLLQRMTKASFFTIGGSRTNIYEKIRLQIH